MSFKQLTRANWTERDPVNEIFHHVDPVAGIASPLSGDDWADQFLGVRLEARAPEDVQNLFAVARGAMVYGHFFYPLYTLGHEQLHRVADAAAAYRFRELGGKPTGQGKVPIFVKRIKWLVDHGAISQIDATRWDAVRELRNISSHPEMQALVTPGEALRTIQVVAELVNALFRPPILRRRR